MARRAEDIYKIASRNKDKLSDAAYLSLKDRAISAVTEMMKEGKLVTEIDLDEEDHLALVRFTSEIRSLNYHYCLIEVQNEGGDVLEHRLRISINHLEKQNGQQEVPQVGIEN